MGDPCLGQVVQEAAAPDGVKRRSEVDGDHQRAVHGLVL